MRSLILSTAARPLLPLMLVLSIVVLLRGHNEPGGGFVGGLLAAAAFTLYALAIGADEAKRMLRFTPRTFIGLGLALAVLSGFVGLFIRGELFGAVWTAIPVPGFDEAIKLGTPVAFDVGVYLVVLGGVLLMVLSLEETYRDFTSRR